MPRAVDLDADSAALTEVAHVEPSHVKPAVGPHLDLQLIGRKVGVVKHDAHPGLRRRLRAFVCQAHPGTGHPAPASQGVGDQTEVFIGTQTLVQRAVQET